jgi:hypothetical protein
MVMELQIKVKSQKLLTLLLYGNYLVFSFAKITYMVWEQLITEPLLTQTTMLEVM